MSSPNGSTKLLWFLFSTAVLVVLAVVGAWAMEQRDTDRELAKTDRELEARVSTLEKQYGVFGEQVKQLDKKIDLLLAERGIAAPR